MIFFFSRSVARRDLPSFPTRRSSDLLRAGLGMLDGMVRLLPTAEVGFLGMVRDEDTLKDRKSTRLNSSHSSISYAVFRLKKKRPCCSRFIRGQPIKLATNVVAGP